MKSENSCVARRATCSGGFLIVAQSANPVCIQNPQIDDTVNYVLTRRHTPETYLKDGHCRFNNNLSKSAIRPLAVYRKNWLFSNSIDGTNACMVVFTMVEIVKVHNLNICKSLKFLLEHRPSKVMTDKQLAELASWGEKFICVMV